MMGQFIHQKHTNLRLPIIIGSVIIISLVLQFPGGKLQGYLGTSQLKCPSGWCDPTPPDLMLDSTSPDLMLDSYALEHRFFQLEEALVSNCSVGESVTGTVDSLIQALQACLVYDWCGHVAFQPASGHTLICATSSPNTSKSTHKGAMVAHRYGCGRTTDPGNLTDGPPFALSKSCNSPDMNGLCQCGLGLYSINAKPGPEGCKSLICSPCQNGFCPVLAHSHIKPSYNSVLQSYTNQTHEGATKIRAINSAIFSHLDKLYTTARMASWIICPSSMNKNFVSGRYGRYISDVAICELNVPRLADVDAKDCRTVEGIEDIVKRTFPQPYVPEHDPSPGFEPSSFEDVRAISFNESVYLTGTVLGRVNDSSYHPILFIKLDNALQKPAEAAVISKCAAASAPIQKNWQPLTTDTELLYVVNTFPLTITKLHLPDGGCTVQQSDADSEPELVRSYKARGLGLDEGRPCSGASNYLRIGPAHWLGVVHQRRILDDNRLVFTHYFVQLHRKPNKLFTVNWISEPWRLPRSQELLDALLPSDGHFGVQFVVGMERVSEDLLLSYGDMDCEAQVASIPNFFQRLPDYIKGKLSMWPHANKHPWRRSTM